MEMALKEQKREGGSRVRYGCTGNSVISKDSCAALSVSKCSIGKECLEFLLEIFKIRRLSIGRVN
jgi:hypothetical protein